MGSPATLRIDIIADATKALAGLDKTANKTQSTGSKIKALGGAVATGFATAKVLEFGKASITAAQESESATRGLAQVFRSMGDHTGNAAKAAEAYAGALSRKIGVEDEAIISAQTLLATFGKASDATARQAGIFDRATAAAADLAAAGYGNLDSNAKQLGKALNDPIKGTAALTKAGVQFTQQQKDQIAAMMAAGDQTGAQKIILGEVEKQVKGTAAATATSTDKMNVAYGETQEAVGKALLPILAKLAPMLVKIAGFIEKNAGWLTPLAIGLGVLAIAWQVASVAATLFGVSMAAALWPVLLVIAAIAALVVVAVLIAKHWQTIKDAAAAAWSWILGAIQAVWNWIKTNWPLLLAILTGPIGIAVALIIRNWDAIKSALVAVWNWIKSAWSMLTDILSAPFRAAWSVISGVIDSIKGGISGAFETVKGIATSIAGAIKAPINAVLRAWNALEIQIPKVDIGPIHFGGGTIGTPNIPLLDTGGLVLRTGLAVVHRGETFSGIGGGRSSSSSSPAVVVNITTSGLGADTPAIQRAVVDALRSYTSRNGPLPIPVRGLA